MSSRPRSFAVRLVGLSLAAVFVVQGAVESHHWLNGNEASRRVYLLIIALVVGLLTATTLRLSARRGGFAGITLTAGAAGGLVAGASWATLASVGPTMPRDAAFGLILVTGCAALAGAIVQLRTRTLRDGCAAALVAAAVGTALIFSVAELTIQDFPSRIPDIVGPVMPAGSTAQQVLVENRIEIADGYVVLPLLLVVLLAVLLLVARASAPRTPGPSHA